MDIVEPTPVTRLTILSQSREEPDGKDRYRYAVSDTALVPDPRLDLPALRAASWTLLLINETGPAHGRSELRRVGDDQLRL